MLPRPVFQNPACWKLPSTSCCLVTSPEVEGTHQVTLTWFHGCMSLPSVSSLRALLHTFLSFPLPAPGK